jgi:hypothetical protein
MSLMPSYLLCARIVSYRTLQPSPVLVRWSCGSSAETPIANVQPYTYPTLVFGACAICQQLAVIFIFLNVFVRLQQVTLQSRLLVWGSVGFVALGYATWILLGHYANVKSQPDRKYVSERCPDPGGK